MRKLFAWLFIFLTLGTALLNVHVGVRAEDDDGDDGEDAEIPSHAPPQASEEEDDADATTADAEEDKDFRLVPSPDVSTSIIFPDYPDKRFPVGEKITVLIGFKNTGKSGFNISYVGAHLNSPFDLSYYIQNFTVREVGATVEPNNEISIEYAFMPDKSLEPLEFHLNAWVLYNNTANDMFMTTFQNGTIELIEKPSEFDAKQFFSYVLFAGVLGLVGYIFLSLSGSLNKTSSSVDRSRSSSSHSGSSSSSSSGGAASSSASALDEWAGPIYKAASKSKSISRASGSKKKQPGSPKAAASS